MNKNKILLTFALFLFVTFVTIIISPPFYTINPGFSGIHLRLGSVVDTKLSSGFYSKYPFIDSIIRIDRRIKKAVIKTEAFSKDLQTVDIEVAINYRVETPLLVYKNIGLDYEQVVIDPFTQESVKAIIAMFTAEELTQRREEAKEMVKRDLERTLQQVHITLVDFNFIHADFQHDFIHAVECKLIAEQQAKQAKYDTLKVKEVALQTQAIADAEAYSLKVQKESVTSKLVLLKAIEKWDGKLPKIITSSALLNLPTDE